MNWREYQYEARRTLIEEPHEWSVEDSKHQEQAP